MKYLTIGLSLFLFTNKSFSKEVPTGHQLVRLVCQSTYVLILEQISSKTLNTKSAISETIDGVVLTTHDEISFTDDAAFRLRIYETSLVSEEKTEKEIIESLLSSKASLDFKNRPMDYRGIGFRAWDEFVFKSKGPYKFLKKVRISLKKDLRGYVETNLGASISPEDGYYVCKKPVLIPEMVEETK